MGPPKVQAPMFLAPVRSMRANGSPQRSQNDEPHLEGTDTPREILGQPLTVWITE